MKTVRKFLVYFPVILVAMQVLVNLYALIDRESYNAAGFYLNTFVGTNIFFAVFLVAFTFSFNFCHVSRYAAVAELLFGIFYLIIQQDNIYNIMFQIVVGGGSLFFTYRHFIKKFPLCRVSLVHKFFGAIFLTGSCSKALDVWEQDIKTQITAQHYDRHFKNNI